MSGAEDSQSSFWMRGRASVSRLNCGAEGECRQARWAHDKGSQISRLHSSAPASSTLPKLTPAERELEPKSIPDQPLVGLPGAFDSPASRNSLHLLFFWQVGGQSDSCFRPSRRSRPISWRIPLSSTSMLRASESSSTEHWPKLSQVDGMALTSLQLHWPFHISSEDYCRRSNLDRPE